ncbi:MAG TPA: N-acetyltransferase [Bryobacteraceae bacterium]|nr:N-acetyltransferase [Bryobacteraceae bacterium]
MISSLRADAVSEPTQAEGNIAVRKAAMHDIAPILHLINGYAAKGIMLPRTEFELSESIRDFSVAVSDDQLVGCGALHFYSPTTAEIRSLAVDEAWKTHGVGRRLIESLVEEAGAFALHAVFAFTYVPEFFRRMGFQEVERGALPLKAWKDCLRCPKFQCCDEIAVMRVLRPEFWQAARLQPLAELADGDRLISLPVIRKPL